MKYIFLLTLLFSANVKSAEILAFPIDLIESIEIDETQLSLSDLDLIIFENNDTLYIQDSSSIKINFSSENARSSKLGGDMGGG